MTSAPVDVGRPGKSAGLVRYVAIVRWLLAYRRDWWASDAGRGAVGVGLAGPAVSRLRNACGRPGSVRALRRVHGTRGVRDLRYLTAGGPGAERGGGRRVRGGGRTKAVLGGFVLGFA